MLIKRASGIEIPSSQITSEHHYLNRRQFMQGAATIAAVAAGGTLLAGCRPPRPNPEELAANALRDELGNAANTLQEITHYNNFYEFSTNKREVAVLAEGYQTSPWEVEVGGLVRNPGTFGMEDILTRFDQEERIYRMRCVEAWSMVIPWQGFPLRKLLDAVEPTSDAKYVRFETVYDPENMPGFSNRAYNWPYVEGLRLDEAMNDLTLLATGIYGEELLPQNGAPIRLVIPWKYGLKGIKSIVKIELVAEQPTTLWMAAGPSEYGFYSNVNPTVDHPRWSQASERPIGKQGRIPTLMFNGYAEQVAHLYDGMDLQVNF